MIPRALHSALEPAGPQAAHIHWLWLVFLWVSIAVYALVIGFVVISLLRRGPGEPGSPQANRAGQTVVGNDYNEVPYGVQG